jgi:hypothetical protein
MALSKLFDSFQRRPWIIAGICLGLMLAVWTIFGQTRHHGFINYDDNVIDPLKLVQIGCDVFRTKRPLITPIAA